MTFARLLGAVLACVVAMALSVGATQAAEEKVHDAQSAPITPRIINQAPGTHEAQPKSEEPASKSNVIATEPASVTSSATPPSTTATESKTSAPTSQTSASDASRSAQQTSTSVVVPQPPPKPTLFIEIDLSHQRMTVSERGQQIHRWTISSGREGFHTPTGTYRPQWMAKMWYSRKYELSPMPHAIFFHQGYAIHGTYATRQIGQPASHGCIRLAPANATTLYKLVTQHGKERTRISLHGSTPTSKTAPEVAERRRDYRERYAYDEYGYRGLRPRVSRRTYSDGSAYAYDDYYAPRRRYPPRYVERPYQPRRYAPGSY